MLEKSPEAFRELDEITSKTDTRDILSHATKQSESYEDYFLVDMDAHVTETQFWPEIIARVDNDVIRQMGEAQFMRPGAGNTAVLNAVPGMTYQPLHGRIPHQAGLLEPVDAKGCHHFIRVRSRRDREPGAIANAVRKHPAVLAVGIEGEDGRTPVFIAATQSGAAPIVKFLLDHGADANPANRAPGDSTPLRQAGTPEQMAEAVIFFLTSASNITGEFLIVDAGTHLGGLPMKGR